MKHNDEKDVTICLHTARLFCALSSGIRTTTAWCNFLLTSLTDSSYASVITGNGACIARLSGIPYGRWHTGSRCCPGTSNHPPSKYPLSKTASGGRNVAICGKQHGFLNWSLINLLYFILTDSGLSVWGLSFIGTNCVRD